ncbi:MAG: tetratricopeptide repeat protein [Spartobacteria bacterium]|nr:tetratricopeptide repeat protein [Spartobacteria bacterium]
MSSIEVFNRQPMKLFTCLFSMSINNVCTMSINKPTYTLIRRTVLLIILIGIPLLFLLFYYFFDGSPRDRLLKKGRQQLVDNQPREAIYTYAKLLRTCPSDIDAMYNLGAAYHNNGWFNEALHQYDQTIQLGRNQAVRAAHSAARIFASQGNTQQAIAYYQEALRLQPDASDIAAEYEFILAGGVK